MPFDLIQPDDAPLRGDGEIDLPADLAALGEQLRDDALHLAKRYPAGAELTRQPEPARRLQSWKKIGVLAASAVATVLAGVVAVQLLDEPTANPHLATAPVTSVPEPSVVTRPEVPATIASPPTVSLTELSGPELEALLDLWQREPARAGETGVSF